MNARNAVRIIAVIVEVIDAQIVLQKIKGMLDMYQDDKQD